MILEEQIYNHLGHIEIAELERKTEEELQNELRIISEIKSIDGFYDSILIEYIDDATTLIINECIERFMKTKYVKYPFAVIQDKEAVN